MTHPGIVFFGNERLATGVDTQLPAAHALLAAGYKINAIIANHEPARSRAARPLEIAQFAHTHSIPLHTPARPSDIADTLAGYNAPIAVLAAYGRIVPEAVINLFPYGIINIHPSLLPKHRGPTPIESVLLQGERETGVSIMRLVRAMDAGPVFAQQSLPLNGTESKQQLADTLGTIGADLLIEVLPRILADTTTPQPQNDAQATYDSLITKQDGTIDWTKPAVRLEREVRAYTGWPRSRSVIFNKDVIINQARAVSGPAGTPGTVQTDPTGILSIATGKGQLVIEQLQPAGKSVMAAADFLRGNQSKQQ